MSTATTTCTYDHDVVAGSLDSYPVVTESTCVTISDPIDINSLPQVSISDMPNAVVATLPAVSLTTGSKACGAASTTPCYGEVTYLDWLTVNIWIIFLVSFLALGVLFSAFRKRSSFYKNF